MTIDPTDTLSIDHGAPMTVPDYVNRFYHALQWNSVYVVGVGNVMRVDGVLGLLSDLLEEQGQRTAASVVKEWQRHQEDGIVSAG